MLSYHNDENLKKLVVSEMKKHQEQDQFIKGSYENLNGKFKGCAVGCTIDSINKILNKFYRTNDHKVFEETIGVPDWLARLQDTFFEGLPLGDNSQFAVDFLEAIPIGINLKPVRWKFCSFILREGMDRMLSQPDLSDELRTQVVNSMREVLILHESAINTGIWDDSAARSAAFAARSAARSAAESAAESARSAARSAAFAARSAAESARSAAESAARSAARSAAESATASAESSAWSAARSAESAARSAWSAARSAESAASESAARSAESAASESAAASAAESAAWSAAESSAWSAARSAESSASSARSAAESAAWSAAYKRYSVELIRLLKESK